MSDKKRLKLVCASQKTSETNHGLNHPAVGIVFRTENILEEICTHLLEVKDLKQFRLVSRICNNEGRRALINGERHWVVVKSKDYDWELGLGHVLTKLEKPASSGGENSHKKLLGWIFKRLELNNWEHSLGKLSLVQQWGHYLTKIHLKQEVGDPWLATFNISNVINTMYNLLTVSCPNLEEMVVLLRNIKCEALSLEFLGQVESFEFPSPLLKLKAFRIKHVWAQSAEQGQVLGRFFTKLVRAAGTALESLEIDFDSYSDEMEGRMLESLLASNVDVSNFQSLKELNLSCAHHVANLSYTVQKCFPKLTKLILRHFNYHDTMVAMRDPKNYQVFPKCFPSLKSLTILFIRCEYITSGKIIYFLRHFPNLEVLTVSCMPILVDASVDIPDPVSPTCENLGFLNFKTENYDLRLLRCAVKIFPNLGTLNLLGFGRGHICSLLEPEYGFRELIDIISPLSRLQNLYVNHAFHTSPQLVDAIQLTANFTDLETLVLSQAAHDDSRQDYNVSLYLTTSDADVQYILDCDCVKRIHSVRLVNFRFATTEEEVEEEAAAKGGHVSFGTIRHCYLDPWVCSQTRTKTCQLQH